MDENGEREVSSRQWNGVFSNPADVEGLISPGILSAVGNEHRRAVITSLNSASDGILQYETLVERVADRVREESERESDDHRQRIRIGLHHIHLPNLEELRIIDYDAETGHVQIAGDQLEQGFMTLVEWYDAYE